MLDIDISGHQVQKSYAQFRGPRNIMLDITKRCNFFVNIVITKVHHIIREI